MQIKIANEPNYSILAKMWLGVLAHKNGVEVSSFEVVIKTESDTSNQHRSKNTRDE